jgi:ABC-type branched-subunit amino acid transport system ATPase component
MRFCSFKVANLRAVRRFEVSDLKDFVVIAGPNGCGKSCVFDGIRLLKSVYGGYSQNEYMQWFGEFEINLNDRHGLSRMFRDPAQPVEISAVIEFSDSERAFIEDNAADLIWPLAWQRVTGQAVDHWSFNRMAVATQLTQFKEPVEQLISQMTASLTNQLIATQYTIALTIRPDGALETAPCLPAEVTFQAYRPTDLGIVEYHSASRSYVRQPLQGINLDARQFQDQRRQQVLYNSQGKYQNVKTELATGYLRNLIAKESDAPVEGEDLNETLKELFRTFFPDKRYEGVQPLPEGSLEFPVVLPEGARHDIDDLSSGEKEILYGYLRLRNSTPRRSVILLDEPELHLNPSLLEGFADFYYRHLGLAQDNQLWLVTHSDTLLRQAIGNSNYRVYHMLTASASSGNQASEVLLDDDVERAVVDLVGDLAGYRPHAKVVILEGKSEDGFDETLIRRLFPELAKRVNLVSAGSKSRVRGLYEALNESAEQVGMGNRFFAIVDRDAEGFRSDEQSGTQVFTWDVYHVENFLLHAESIRAAATSLAGKLVFNSNEEVLDALNAIATGIISRLTIEEIQAEVNDALVEALKIGAPPDSTDVAADLLPSIDGSFERLNEIRESYSAGVLPERVDAVRADLQGFLDDESWAKRFPGRLILRQFSSQYLPGVSYEAFRNVIVEKIVLSEYRPENMREVLQTIVDA